MLTTDGGLLQRLRQEGAEAAWTEFFNLYGPAILRYGRKLGLGDEESKDILQSTMVDLIRVLPGFEYQPERGRFRGFLFTIVHRKAIEYWRRERRRPENGGPHPSDNMLVDSGSESEVNARWREILLEVAMEDLRRSPAVSDRDLDAFTAYAVDGRRAADVAAEFEITENHLYQIKARMLKRLRARADWLWSYME